MSNWSRNGPGPWNQGTNWQTDGGIERRTRQLNTNELQLRIERHHDDIIHGPRLRIMGSYISFGIELSGGERVVLASYARNTLSITHPHYPISKRNFTGRVRVYYISMDGYLDYREYPCNRGQINLG